MPVKSLNDKHILAEHREIKRIPNIVKKGKAKLDDIPDTFTLGKGHVRFFYDKLQYLYDRYNCLYNECIVRGFNVTPYYDAWEGVPDELMNNWDETPEAMLEVRQRIFDRAGYWVNTSYLMNYVDKSLLEGMQGSTFYRK